jgi:hypothetical protein
MFCFQTAEQLAELDSLSMLSAARTAPSGGSFGTAAVQLGPLLACLMDQGQGDPGQALQPLAVDVVVGSVAAWATAAGEPPPCSCVVRGEGAGGGGPVAFIAWAPDRPGSRAVKAFTDSFGTGQTRTGRVGLPLALGAGRAAEVAVDGLPDCVLPVHFAAGPFAPHNAKIVISNLPPQLAFVGLTTALLRCAGYDSSRVQVVAEQVGGRAVHGVVVAECLVVVAFVRAPPEDPFLCSLPAVARFGGETVSLRVDRLNSVLVPPSAPPILGSPMGGAGAAEGGPAPPPVPAAGPPPPPPPPPHAPVPSAAHVHAPTASPLAGSGPSAGPGPAAPLAPPRVPTFPPPQAVQLAAGVAEGRAGHVAAPVPAPASAAAALAASSGVAAAAAAAAAAAQLSYAKGAPAAMAGAGIRGGGSPAVGEAPALMPAGPPPASQAAPGAGAVVTRARTAAAATGSASATADLVMREQGLPPSVVLAQQANLQRLVQSWSAARARNGARVAPAGSAGGAPPAGPSRALAVGDDSGAGPGPELHAHLPFPPPGAPSPAQPPPLLASPPPPPAPPFLGPPLPAPAAPRPPVPVEQRAPAAGPSRPASRGDSSSGGRGRGRRSHDRSRSRSRGPARAGWSPPPASSSSGSDCEYGVRSPPKDALPPAASRAIEQALAQPFSDWVSKAALATGPDSPPRAGAAWGAAVSGLAANVGLGGVPVTGVLADLVQDQLPAWCVNLPALASLPAVGTALALLFRYCFRELWDQISQASSPSQLPREVHVRLAGCARALDAHCSQILTGRRRQRTPQAPPPTLPTAPRREGRRAGQR